MTILFFSCCCSLYAQEQIDFVGNVNIAFEKKLSQSLVLTNLNSVKCNNDFQEIGYYFIDAGIKYKQNQHLSFNFNYRYAQRRNLANAFDTRHFIYADIDLNKGLDRYNIYSTQRFQSMYYSHLNDSYKRPLFYLRNQIGLKYKINYFLQPYVESEFFTPLFHHNKLMFDQYRISIGCGYTFNQKIKLTLFEQWQQQINRVANNTNFLTSIILAFRW